MTRVKKLATPLPLRFLMPGIRRGEPGAQCLAEMPRPVRGAQVTAFNNSAAFRNSTPVHIRPKVQDVTIVVPCYNEAERLNARAFLTYLDEVQNVRLLFVDDGSADRTLQCLKALQAKRPDQIAVLALDQNSGKAEAVRQGMLQATREGSRLVGFWDADLATPLDAIDDFVRVANKYHAISVIFGSRRALLGHRIRRNFARRVVSRICALMARRVVKLPVGDTQCGAKLFRNTSSLRMAIAAPFTAGWLFDVELFARIAAATPERHRAFYEYPLAEWHEVEGSKVSTRAIVRSGLHMLRFMVSSNFARMPEPANLNHAPHVMPAVANGRRRLAIRS